MKKGMQDKGETIFILLESNFTVKYHGFVIPLFEI